MRLRHGAPKMRASRAYSRFFAAAFAMPRQDVIRRQRADDICRCLLRRYAIHATCYAMRRRTSRCYAILRACCAFAVFFFFFRAIEYCYSAAL